MYKNNGYNRQYIDKLVWHRLAVAVQGGGGRVGDRLIPSHLGPAWLVIITIISTSSVFFRTKAFISTFFVGYSAIPLNTPPTPCNLNLTPMYSVASERININSLFSNMKKKQRGYKSIKRQYISFSVTVITSYGYSINY